MVTRAGRFGRGVIASLAIVISLSVMSPAKAIECVPYARQISGVQISGDAWTWWGQARSEGYGTGVRPRTGAVMVFKRANGMRRGHVAVVRNVINSREVVVDHANWATRRSGRKGMVDRGVSVIDVSPRNDWSMVRVWYPVVDDYGTSVYPLFGFIYNGDGKGRDNGDVEQVMASADNTPVRSAVPRPANAGMVAVSVPARGAASGTLDAQLAGGSVQIREGKPVVMGRPVVSAGDPGAPLAELVPTRRPTERADGARTPAAKRSVVEVSGTPVRLVALKPARDSKGGGAETVSRPPVLPTLKPVP